MREKSAENKKFNRKHFKEKTKQMAKKQKLNLIEELTTHKCDYKSWPLYPVKPKSTRPREEEEPKPPPCPVYIDIQSHAPIEKGTYVPFDLYIEPKPIVGTDPRKAETVDKISTHKTNCKYNHLTSLLPPAFPIDQIQNEKDLQVVLDYTYVSMHKILMKEAVLKRSQLPRPSSRVATEENNIAFKSTLYSPLPPGWICAAKHWDSLQSRFLGDPFKTFWSRRGPEVECSCCCNPLPQMLSQETKDEIKQLIEEDKLRLPYDVTKTGYGGYRVAWAKGVPLRKS